MKKLLDRGDVSPDSSDNNRYTALSRAADGGHELVVKQPLDREDTNPPPQTTKTGTHFRGLRYEGPNQWSSRFCTGKTPNSTARLKDQDSSLVGYSARACSDSQPIIGQLDINSCGPDGKWPAMMSLSSAPPKGHDQLEFTPNLEINNTGLL